MTTLSVTRTVRKRGKDAPTPERTSFLPRFDFRRPFDALWGLFSSLRLLIVLLSLLVIVSFIGVLIAQAPAEVISSPTDYASWVAVNAHAQFKDFTGLLDWLQLFVIFRSWYFKVLIVLLALNILVGGTINRFPAIWQKFRHPQFKRAEGFYANSPVKVGVTVGNEGATTAETVAGLRAFFHKRGMKVDLAKESNEQVAYFYVHKHSWTTLSTFVFHICLISGMLCAVLTTWSGFGSNSMAQRVLPAPIYTYFQDLAGFSYNQPLPDGTQGVVYPLGTAHNVFYRVKSFTSVLDPVRLMPIDFYTDMELYQDGKLVAQKRIRVNDPLTYQGVTYHQASFMMYSDLTIRDQTGNVLYSAKIPLDSQKSTQDPNSGNVFNTNTAYDIPITSYGGETMNVTAISVNSANLKQWLVLAQGYDSHQTKLFAGGGLSGVQNVPTCVNAADNTYTTTAQFGCKLSNGWYMTVNDVRQGTVLLVTKDSGSPLLFPILFLLVVSLWVTFGMPPRRYWVRVEGDQVRLAALKEHFANMQRDLDGFARALGNRPLRPDQVEAVPDKVDTPAATPKSKIKPKVKTPAVATSV